MPCGRRHGQDSGFQSVLSVPTASRKQAPLNGQGRRALTLVPDHHVCVVFADQVMDTVPQAVARLQESVSRGQPLDQRPKRHIGH